MIHDNGDFILPNNLSRINIYMSNFVGYKDI